MRRYKPTQNGPPGLKKIVSLKQNSGKSLDKFGTIKGPSQNCELFSATMKKQLKNAQLNHKLSQKLQKHHMISDFLHLLKHFYQDDQTGYFERCRIYLQSQCQRKVVADYQNKLIFLKQSLMKKSYQEIQTEIIKEWGKFTLLNSLRGFWYEIMLNVNFINLNDFLEHYNKLRNFFGQVAHLLFKRFFTIIIKENVDVLDKLIDRTSHYLITSTDTWHNLYETIIRPHLIIQYHPISYSQIFLQKYNLSSLQLNISIIDITRPQCVLPQTTKKLKQLLQQTQLYPKIQLLIQYHETLKQQIKQYQDNLQLNNKIKQYYILSRDDIISCLIYCVIKGNINLKQLGISVMYIYEMLLNDRKCEKLLKKRCGSNLADLQVVYQYLCQWIQKQQDRNQQQQLALLMNVSQILAIKSIISMNQKSKITIKQQYDGDNNYNNNYIIDENNNNNNNQINDEQQQQLISLINYSLPAKSKSLHSPQKVIKINRSCSEYQQQYQQQYQQHQQIRSYKCHGYNNSNK